jgi:hypothetical protein
MKNKLLTIFLLLGTLLTNAGSLRQDKCKVFGAIYITKIKSEANVIVYLEESEGLADLKVFKVDNPFSATKSGLWQVTETKAMCDFVVYIEKEIKSQADFTIAFTSGEAFAGCE